VPRGAANLREFPEDFARAPNLRRFLEGFAGEEHFSREFPTLLTRTKRGGGVILQG
jgi:hypothetical protein